MKTYQRNQLAGKTEKEKRMKKRKESNYYHYRKSPNYSYKIRRGIKGNKEYTKQSENN